VVLIGYSWGASSVIWVADRVAMQAGGLGMGRLLPLCVDRIFTIDPVPWRQFIKDRLLDDPDSPVDENIQVFTRGWWNWYQQIDQGSLQLGIAGLPPFLVMKLNGRPIRKVPGVANIKKELKDFQAAGLDAMFTHVSILQFTDIYDTIDKQLTNLGKNPWRENFLICPNDV
jgi:hypothetical protein